MLFQKKGFKGSRILSTITSYAGGSGGGCKKKKSAEQLESMQVTDEGEKTNIVAKPNLGQTDNTIAVKNDTPKKSYISALTAAKLTCNEWNIPKVSSPRVYRSSPSGTNRLRPPQKKSIYPVISKGYNSSWDHPAFRSSLYNGPNYLSKFQKSNRLSSTNSNERLFRNLRYSLHIIQESEDENIH